LRYLVGIDDTDNVAGPGTGHRARSLGALLDGDARGQLIGITRHQLLVAPGIPYTSHNSSACLGVTWNGALESLAGLCRDYLQEAAAPESDVGLCVASEMEVSDSVRVFGRRAKHEIVKMTEAESLAAEEGLLLEGLTGTWGGEIGALSAVGLRATGGDGRFIWLPGTRQLRGAYPADWLCAETGIDVITTAHGDEIPAVATVDVGDWVRPVLRAGRATLLVEPESKGLNGHWHVVSKEIVKACSG